MNTELIKHVVIDDPSGYGFRWIPSKSEGQLLEVSYVLWMLPVEPWGPSQIYGDALQEVFKTAWFAENGWTIVCPQFKEMPFLVDHPHDPKIQQRTYLTESIMPTVSSLMHDQPARHFLFGFSKSGWAAVRLLVDYPKLFTAAVSWDAPLMQTAFENKWDIPKVFGSEANFQSHTISSIVQRSDSITDERQRLALLGAELFPHHAGQAATLFAKSGVPVYHNDDVDGPHQWDVQWMDPALACLMRLIGDSDNK